MPKSITSHGCSTLVSLLLAASLGRCVGQIFQDLYSFTAGPDGLSPQGALIQASDGNFYGTTKYGPGPVTEDWSGYGTVFKITPEGAVSYYGWIDNWRLTIGHFDGDIDEVRISNTLRP
jgi:hypothetical protein